MKMEIWKDIDEYEGYYQISSEGRVRSLDRYDKLNRLHRGRIIVQIKDSDGYRMVSLWKDGKRKVRKINNLMKIAFFENYEGLTIDHIDTNKSNNKLSNLRLVDIVTNIRNPITQEHFRTRRHYNRTIVNVTTKKEYNNAREAYEDTGVNRGHICDCCRGERKSAGGFIWKYKEIA